MLHLNLLNHMNSAPKEKSIVTFLYVLLEVVTYEVIILVENEFISAHFHLSTRSYS
jgi:hypothetical protein